MRNSASTAILDQENLDPLVAPVQTSDSKDHRDPQETALRGETECIAGSSKGNTCVLDPFDLLDCPENDPLLAPPECIPSAFYAPNVSEERDFKKRRQIQNLVNKLMTHPLEKHAPIERFRKVQPLFYSHFYSANCSDFDFFDEATTYDENVLDGLSNNVEEPREDFRKIQKLPSLEDNVADDSAKAKFSQNIQFVRVEKRKRKSEEEAERAIQNILSDVKREPLPVEAPSIQPTMAERKVASKMLLPVAVKARLIPEVARSGSVPTVKDILKQLIPSRTPQDIVTVPRLSNAKVLAPRQPTSSSTSQPLYPVKVVQQPQTKQKRPRILRS